jgi:hypothetical protein
MSAPRKAHAKKLVTQPFDSNPIRVVPPMEERFNRVLRPWQAKDALGPKVWHRVSGTRRSAPLPTESKGPIFGTAARKKKGVAGA